MTRIIRLVCLLAVAMSVACAKSNETNPLAPSAPSAPVAPQTGAQIAGTVVPVGGATLAGVRVTVQGSTLSTAIDAANHFSLTGVPAGAVSLHFDGAGVSATLPIGTLADGATVTLDISLGATTAQLGGPNGVSASEFEEEGAVVLLPPAVGAGTFTVAGRLVVTNASTRFVDGATVRSFADLRVGTRVKVAGTVVGSTSTARQVEWRTEDTPQVETSVTGVLTARTGSAPNLTLLVGGTTVRTTSATVVRRSGNTIDFSVITVGQTLEVEGLRQPDNSITASKVTLEDEPETESSITGTLSSQSGSAPTLTLIVAGTTVRTTAATVVRRSGNTLSLSAIAVGQLLQVEGLRQPDNSITATKLTIEDEVENEVEYEGVLSGLTGACPAIRFTVSGKTVQADAATDFRSACSVLVPGVTVKVKGVQLADLTVKAVRLEKK